MTYPDETTRTAKTAGGTSYVDVTLDPMGSGVTSRLFVPTTVADGADIVLLIYAHGSGTTAADMTTRGPVAGAMARGWVMMSSDAHGNAWASQTALDDYRRCYDWAASVWNVTDVLLEGASMGGLTVMNLAGKATIPDVRASVSIDGALNLRACYDGSFASAIKTAYGIASDGSDYAAKTAGFDPCDVDPSAWTGQTLFLEASPADTVIAKTAHSDVFAARVDPVASVTYVEGTGTHTATENFVPNAVLAFYDTALAAAEPPPTPAGRNSVLARRLLAL